jgi:hypothetical protein
VVAADQMLDLSQRREVIAAVLLASITDRKNFT